MKIVFFGSSKHVIPVIESLNKNFDLVLVVTTERASNDPVISFCNAHKIKFVSVLAVKDLIRQVQSQKADLGVVADFGIIIPEEVLTGFPKGIINIHPSLLPKYRGPTPVQTALLQGDTKTGISIIKLDREMDHGPILYQEEIELNPYATSHELLPFLFKKAAKLLPKIISEYIKGTHKLSDQIHRNATFTKLFSRMDGCISVDNPPSPEDLGRMIRAYYPWPGVWTKYKLGQREQVVKFMPNRMIQVEGKKPVSYKDFENGYLEATDLLRKLSLK